MSNNSVSSLGKLPAALINSGNTTHLKPDPQKPETRGEQIKFSSDTEIENLGKEAKQALSEGRFTDITDMFEPRYDTYEGKTTAENKEIDFIVGSMYTKDGQPILDPGYGETHAKRGAPDHAFFYHNTDSLVNEATEYAKLGDNEEFRHWNIHNLNFVRDTLDFFTDGNYTNDDVNNMQKQMNGVVRELAQQIKNGETVDLSKLQSKVTIGGVDVSFSQVLDFQKVGSELKESFDQVGVGQLNTQSYAEMGIAKSMAGYYGSDKGEIGAMFSSAMDKLYEKGVVKLEKMVARVTSANSGFDAPITERERDAIKTAIDIRDIFATLDISSKENLTKDFSSKLSMMRNMAQSHCNQFGISTSHISLDGSSAGIMNTFNAWLNN